MPATAFPLISIIEIVAFPDSAGETSNAEKSDIGLG